ncbi:hypothetical protein XENTR_v10015649 [Xenopus tropicalis]|uniref:Uncharacterized protein LOC116406440 n=1 Tax=Xenopus tropicalis TaxID=8364 RepID=A0A8J1JUG3_XENTR|nr:uncharacterized protein LOC116406440 [Xenopus tropicalis]XP_031760242.1 uncharacterized protein LOC116406440 [Xenopus tropicalis]KAE8595248.1 hypothetical protein XENTR_v10015649 [Xenopus tropicalis]KAE8595249.1 hypothetical protein XENTR_v10015649 [Xenopus tropicalis]
MKSPSVTLNDGGFSETEPEILQIKIEKELDNDDHLDKSSSASVTFIDEAGYPETEPETLQVKIEKGVLDSEDYLNIMKSPALSYADGELTKSIISCGREAEDFAFVKMSESYQPEKLWRSHQNELAHRSSYLANRPFCSRLNINTKLLIHEVQQRPALFNKTFPDYGDKYKKKILWDEVCEVLIPDWYELSKKEKAERTKEVQKRWRSLKDCFRRELAAQRKARKSGSSPSKRKIYIYFDDLLFLLPTMEAKPALGNMDTDDSDDESTSGQVASCDIEELSQQSSIHRPPKMTSGKHAKKLKNVPEPAADKETITIAESFKYVREKNYESDQDEDRLFLLSLVSEFKMIPQHRKTKAKIQILELLQGYAEPHMYNGPSHQYPPHYPAPYQQYPKAYDHPIPQSASPNIPPPCAAYTRQSSFSPVDRPT